MAKKKRSGSYARALLEGMSVAGGAAVPASDAPATRYMTTGIDSVDMALGVEGYPLGRIVVVHGPAGVGKTTLSLLAIREAQSRGGIGVYLDFERKLEVPWARHLGVDPDEMILWPTRSAKATEDLPRPSIEDGFRLCEGILRKIHATPVVGRRSPVVIVWDSLHGPEAQATIEGDYNEPGFARPAHAYGHGWKKFVPILAGTGALLIAVSQVRTAINGRIVSEKVGVGNAVMFHATQVLLLKQKAARGKTSRDGDRVQVIVAKNQVARPWKKTHYDLHYESGIDTFGATLEAAKVAGLASDPSGGWTRISVPEYPRPVKVQGVGGPKGLAAWARANPEAFVAFRGAVRSEIGLAEVEELLPAERDRELAELEKT